VSTSTRFAKKTLPLIVPGCTRITYDTTLKRQHSVTASHRAEAMSLNIFWQEEAGKVAKLVLLPVYGHRGVTAGYMMKSKP
jgi:hypothetical protein